MIVRRCLTPTAVFIALTLLGGFDGSAAERWSRQVSNSEWIPLANPQRAGQLPQEDARGGLLTSATHLPNPIQSLALPPALQHQYQEQLIQLQKTQESIQKLLLLQQQLRAQQQILQSQAYVPYSSAEDEKQALPPSAVQAPETLIPPHPSSDALPPVYPPQNFLSQRPGLVHQNLNEGQVVLQHGESAEDAQERPPHTYVPKQGSQRPDGKRLKGHQGLPQSSLIGSNEEEEVQLVYVPAETLAQRGQLKRNRGRKPYPVRQQQRENIEQGNIDQASLSPEQAAFARQVLQQIHKDHEDNAHFLNEERTREFTRLNEEQKALERKTRLQQEALQREQELLRQKEAEKKRKELERLEEIAKQRELDRIRETREKQRQEELERRRVAEIRVKEEKRREEEAQQREDRQKQLELESQQRDQLRTVNHGLLQQNPQSQALVREQPHRQHLADGTRAKKIRNRPRQRVNQEQSGYHDVAATTPSPNQPPLSVYMGGSSSKLESVKVTDVLRLLRDAKTIAVLDNVGPESPQVFVGPSNLDPPYGYAKFDLPYLSSIDHNRVERKVDKLPFFVAPLSFDPPPGYSKIPFPAPHIGSVVVNTLSEVSSDSAPVDEQNPNPMPLIEPNSYTDADQSGSIATTASYDSSSASPNFRADSNGPKYEPSHSTPPTGSRFRFRQYYDGKPASVVSTSYYEREQSAKAKPSKYYEQESKSTTPQSPKFDTTVSYRQEVSYSSTPSFQDEAVSSHDPSAKEQDLAAQLALINQELEQQRESQRYNTAEQYHGQSNLESYDANDVRAPVGSAQYNLPAELPPISPHLPGLINSLLDKQEGNLPVATTPPTMTTTSTPAATTARLNSTTYRPRTRSRVVPTRSRTTQAPANKTDRARRPTYNRSKSRFSTTTEEYHEPSYEPTKARAPETTQKPNAIEHRRPTSRTQKLRTRDRTSSAVQSHNTQPGDLENYPTQSDSQGNVSPDAYSPANGPASNLQQKETPSPGVSDYTRENYSPTTATQTENYPPLREFTVQHGVPLVSGDYSRSQNYPQNQPQEANYRQSATYDQNGGFEQAALEMTPVNGFNYQIASVNSPDHTSPERPRYQSKLEDANYNLASTEDPRIREEHRYSPIYEVSVAQTQPDYNSFRNVDDGKIENGATETDPGASPIFVPLQQSKHEEYELRIPSTERPLVEISTKSTTTPANLIIRQRVRGRLSGSRPHQDSAVQTRPRGSQDEYVRFSVVSHDSTRTNQRQRDGTRTRPRVRPQSHGSQVQTEGNEYIKIHAAQQQRLIATTTPPTTTSTTTTDRTSNEDVDYGFIRPPNFQPVNSPQSVHPVDSRFQTPVTYRPALSEIQHIIPNDETAVESSPAHILKNRPKYQQTPTRRPTTKTFTTTTTSTTTETVPVATTIPDNRAYTTRQKTRPDETKTTRAQGRIRRPAKKRTTSTTESGLEANNELPLDENYPRITPQQLPVTAAGQQPLYDDNFDVTPQFALNRNRPAQFYEESGENYPQEFLLNFGNLPEQSRREEYDQTQLASIHTKKYSNSGHVSSDASSAGDIYGAESQWSTKLSKTSFQPSFAASNRVADETRQNRNRIHNDQTSENAPEIITAGPEVPSVTMIVSADYQKRLNNADEVMDAFGKKTNAQDHTEKLNATTAVTSSPTSSETRNWMGREENFTEQIDDAPKVKIMADSTGRKTRRKRIRVRVRPLPNDFVIAESQHHDSATNSLHRDEYKYNYESKTTTAQPITTTIAATTGTAAETTKKSMLQDFLEEMLKKGEVSIPTRVYFATTESPTTTPYIVSDHGETATLKENHMSIGTTLIPNASTERAESATGSRDNSQEATSKEAAALIQETEARNKTKSDENSQEDQSEQNNLEDIEMLNERYSLPTNYPDGSGTSREIEDAMAEMTGFPVATDEIRKLSAIEKQKKEHIMTLRRQKVNAGGSETHPKNHRAKWSEVRYPPSALDKSAPSSYPTTSFPSVVARNEGDGSVKTLSAYVKAIFDSMKSAEREDGVEIAKVVESKSETPANNSRFNGADSSAREASTTVSEEVNRRAGTTVTAVTQGAKESATSREEARQGETTTKESVTTLETTTLIPDTTANTVTPSEVTTEPSTTTFTAKTITSVKQTASNVAQTNSTMLGKVLRTSTTTKVSHMTEICYRGRCVMTKPNMDDLTR
nr:PREDICTED: uncharacterized protein LOC105676629 [Linepithema humile]